MPIYNSDETWSHQSTPKTKGQSKQWSFLASFFKKKLRATLSVNKVMIAVFWDVRRGILMGHAGTTIISATYLQMHLKMASTNIS